MESMRKKKKETGKKQASATVVDDDFIKLAQNPLSFSQVAKFDSDSVNIIVIIAIYWKQTGKRGTPHVR